MAYPDTDLRNDALDPLYGGRPALEWGGGAWQWINNVIRVLEEAHLLYNRREFRCIAPVVAQMVVPGDVVAVDLTANGPLSIPSVRKVAGGDASSATVRILGVVVVGAAAGKRASVATHGIVPRLVTGFVQATGGADIAVDYATSRLKVAAGADVVIGSADPGGNVLLALES